MDPAQAVSTLPILFWGAREKYGAFSNFYPCIFTDKDGVKYNCSEQYFMVQKLKAFDPENQTLFVKLINEKNPKQIKQYGRQIRNYDDKKWNALRYGSMLEGITLKFTQNPKLSDLLLSTGTNLIAEASPYDRIWGIGMNASVAKNIPVPQWRGQNLLGKALMELRGKLKH